jgi:uncharacterized protein YndB with AHSA1/START domain
MHLLEEGSMTAEPRVEVSARRSFRASPERVFDAWLDPDSVGRWLFATPQGEMVRIQIEPQIGGRYTIVERREGVDVLHTGTYLEIDRPRRLVFTLQVPHHASNMDPLTIDVLPEGDGSRLVLTHHTAPAPAEELARYEQGWSTILRGLARQLGEN